MEKYGCDSVEALQRLKETVTYDVWMDRGCELGIESKEYILDMLKSEVEEDWERFMVV